MNSAVKLLDIAAEKFENRIAISDEFCELTFSELKNKAQKIGTALIDNNIGIISGPIIVYLKKSVECIVCFSGIMYSGNPYVPVSGTMPVSRIEKIINNLSPAAIITDEERIDGLSDIDLKGAKVYLYSELIKTSENGEIIEKTVDKVIDTDPIYIMYTSGSTGDPKGVTVTHRGVIDYANWVASEFSFNKDDIFGNQAPFYFDNSIFDIYTTMLIGAKMVIIPEALFNFPLKLPEFLRDNHITVIFWVPTVLINVANSGVLEKVSLPELRAVLFCGEVMPNRQLNIWRKAYKKPFYANLYGPTEITDVCAYYLVDKEYEDHEPLPIGKACRNTRIIILDEDNNIAPPLKQGELCVIGTGVALGYWNAHDVTDKVFVDNPTSKNYNEKIYRTGDIAYFDENGNIMYVGRMDSQIKLKGNRIELGEIENAAKVLENVENACAIFDQQNEKIILFLESSHEFKLRLVNVELKKYIPSYMLPGEIVVMPKLPHTENDKINRVELKKSLQLS